MDAPVKDASAPPAASPRRHRLSRAMAGAARMIGNHPYAVGMAGTLAAIVVMIVPLAMMAVSRHEVIDHARETSENLNSIIALDLERNFRFYDVQLQDLVRSVETLRAWPLSTGLQDRALFRSLPDSAYVDGKFIVDASGRILASWDGKETDPALRLSDRDYFFRQRHNPSAGLVVSHPFRSRINDGKLAIALTRRINGPDGSFAGIAFFEVRLEFFQRLFDRINVVAPGIVEILLDDGTVLAAKPFSESRVGTSVAGLPAFRPMAARGSGSVIATGTGAIERLYTYRHVPDLPLIAVVAPSMEDVAGRWRRQFIVTACVAGLWGMVLIAGAWLLAYTLRDKLRAEAELTRLATTDPLTRLDNRRTLDERLQGEWDRAVRDKNEMSILFIDIDRFKLFNDTYGHAAGDEILATVAKCIAESVRRSVDVAARYGGEEFTVVLPGTGHDGAVRVAETIRGNVEALDISNRGSETGRLTLSIGCASCRPIDGGSPEKLVSIADEQLYKAKSSGRNQVRAVVAKAMTAQPAPQD